MNIESHLNYISSVNSTYLSGGDNAEVASRIHSIQEKRNDQKLYLAIIGEFSSGKSTFINALLGFRLLKEAVMPSTACATYIECHAQKLSVNVTFFNGDNYIASEFDYSVLRSYILRKYNLNCEDIYQIIHALTSNQSVAINVKNLCIQIPGTAIPSNVVIIDTPGFNPGSSSVANHQEITRDIVENVADAAIILTSQEQAMSATLSRFLKKNFERCLHRCTFVVTKFDTLFDEIARKEVLDYARQRIVQDLGISSPKLCGISAVTMLPVKNIPSDRESDWLFLKQSFIDFMQQTWLDLRKSKESMLSEHVYTLVKDVVTLCSDKLSSKESSLQKEKKFLEEHRVEAIQLVCNKMKTIALTELRNAFSKISVSFYSSETNSINYASDVIKTGQMSLANFKNSMMPNIKSHVQEEAKKTLSSLDSSINRIVGGCMREQIQKMNTVFLEHYSQFPSLVPTEETPSIELIHIRNPKLSFDVALSKVEALDSKENKAAAGGAAAAAAAGFLLGGPLGALAGGFVGLVVGAGAGDQSDEMRSSSLSLMRTEISSFFSDLKIKVDRNINSSKTKYENIISSFAEQHVSKYGIAVQQLILNRQNKIDSLKSQIANLHNAITCLHSIIDEIEHELSVLKFK